MNQTLNCENLWVCKAHTKEQTTDLDVHVAIMRDSLPQILG